MAEEKQQDGQKTLVSFIVGLLIGGMLVWAFSGPADDADIKVDNDDKSSLLGDLKEGTDETGESIKEGAENTTETVAEALPKLEVGDGSVDVKNQPAAMSVELNKVTYPVSEGWIGVREYTNGELGFIKGVVRFSESQGLVPNEIILQQPTIAGRDYAIVIYSEDGDFKFNLAGDVQLDSIFDTFTAE